MKLMELGKDHGVMVDEGNNIYCWGRNDNGQLGIESTRNPNSIVILDEIRGKVDSIAVNNDNNYLLLESGKVLEWPSMVRGENVLKPTVINFDRV